MSYFRNFLKKSGEYLDKFADDKEAQYYADQVPEEPTVIKQNVVCLLYTSPSPRDDL